MNKNLTTSVVASLLLATSSNLYSQDFSGITVSSSSITTTEKNATYSTEIYTKEDIENSKSKDIYDFLNSQSSVNIAPSYGNTFSQKIDLRGYGIGDGYQNIVIMVNGRRLNNIDMSSQLLSSIPIESVEKIEIIKGSGSVEFGDNANAGAINIITNGKNSNYIKTYFGNDGLKNSTLSLGYNSENFIINGYLDYRSEDGSRYQSNGQTNNSYNRNKKLDFTYFINDDLEFKLERNYSNMNIKYGGSLTLAQYLSNPNQSTSTFTEQYFSSYVTTISSKYYMSKDYTLDISYSDEDKISRFSSGWTSDYDYNSFSSKISVNKNNNNVVLGIDGFQGDREGSFDITTKDNLGLFISSKISLDKDTSLSIGGRVEKVEYTYNPNIGTTLNDDLELYAFDLGVNHSIDDSSSIFANYNKSFQSPDIDRFFTNGTFNSFIKPAKVNNYNIGYSNFKNNNKLKLTLFYADLKDEIYYYSTGNWLTSYNTNIDKSHKYGLELFDKYQVNNNLYTSINYSYIVAKIDEENDGAGAYNGKDLPGVSNHNITLNLGYDYNNLKTVVSHTYRSETFAANDFENNFSQKQNSYNSTDLNFAYNYRDFEFFVKVQNVLDKRNGLWINDNSIYPINFERTYYAGVKYKF